MRLLLDEADRRERKLVINIGNMGEVFYLSVKARDLAYDGRVLENLRSRIVTLPAGNELLLRTANLPARHPISYAGAFAVATAIAATHPCTGDPELQAMAEGRKRASWSGSPDEGTSTSSPVRTYSTL